MGWEYTQDRMPVCCKAPSTHTVTHSFTPRWKVYLPTWEQNGNSRWYVTGDMFMGEICETTQLDPRSMWLQCYLNTVFNISYTFKDLYLYLSLIICSHFNNTAIIILWAAKFHLHFCRIWVPGKGQVSGAPEAFTIFHPAWDESPQLSSYWTRIDSYQRLVGSISAVGLRWFYRKDINIRESRAMSDKKGKEK